MYTAGAVAYCTDGPVDATGRRLPALSMYTCCRCSGCEGRVSWPCVATTVRPSELLAVACCGSCAVGGCTREVAGAEPEVVDPAVAPVVAGLVWTVGRMRKPLALYIVVGGDLCAAGPVRTGAVGACESMPAGVVHSVVP